MTSEDHLEILQRGDRLLSFMSMLLIGTRKILRVDRSMSNLQRL
jgi:hypothetical protein